jgi:hypothetical protein
VYGMRKFLLVIACFFLAGNAIAMEESHGERANRLFGNLQQSDIKSIRKEGNHGCVTYYAVLKHVTGIISANYCPKFENVSVAVSYDVPYYEKNGIIIYRCHEGILPSNYFGLIKKWYEEKKSGKNLEEKKD